ncbi:MAG: rhomboid family intramembrane serine protease [Edaphocola sp.]
MKAEFSRQRGQLMANYGRNALIQLIAACAVGFILAYAMYVIVLVISPDQKILVNGVYKTVGFQNAVSPYIALQPFKEVLHKPWVLITYAWAHSSFMNLLSNMLWLYCFGSVVQSLVGYREIVPLYISTSVIGACFYVATDIIWPTMPGSTLLLGASAGIAGFAAAAITLAPRYRFYLGEQLSIPLWAVLAVYAVLNVVALIGNYSVLSLILGGGLVGFLYVKLLRTGSKPGAWFYGMGNSIQTLFAPDEYNEQVHKKKRLETYRQLQNGNGSKEASIDQLLDKINQKGYDSLSSEEKETLLRASREN